MSTVVVKFGGGVIEDPTSFARIAKEVGRFQGKYSCVVVVVSAMGEMTKELLSLAHQVSQDPPKREQDMLLSVGERISMALLAMALKECGIDAISFTGSQAGIITCMSHTEAKIVDVKPWRLLPHLEAGRVVIVAGFQGVSEAGEITTLGPSGSDLTAVALGKALSADKVVFYKDVGGIFDADPKTDSTAKLQKLLDYTEALVIAERGAILQAKAVKYAADYGVKLEVCGFESSNKTVVTCREPKQLVCQSHG